MHFPAFHVQLPFLLISFCDKDFAEKFKPVLHVEKITNKNTNQKEHLRTLYWPYPTKANLIASPGRDSNIRILCGYECWVSFWLVGLGSIGHNSSVPAVAIPLRGSHFSCHRGRAAPNTLNDPPLGETTRGLVLTWYGLLYAGPKNIPARCSSSVV